MVLHLTKDNFKDFINSNEKVLVDFWASWCGPCRMLAPIMEELEKDYPNRVAKVNVDEEEELAQAFGIQSIPTILIFKEGKLVDKTVGYQPKVNFEKYLK